MPDTGLHFKVQCILCSGSLVAESDRLTVVVVAAQAHFLEDHKEHLTGRQVLENKSLAWTIEEYIKREKTQIRPLHGLSFEAILKEVNLQNSEASNLPPLQLLITT